MPGKRFCESYWIFAWIFLFLHTSYLALRRGYPWKLLFSTCASFFCFYVTFSCEKVIERYKNDTSSYFSAIWKRSYEGSVRLSFSPYGTNCFLFYVNSQGSWKSLEGTLFISTWYFVVECFYVLVHEMYDDFCSKTSDWRMKRSRGLLKDKWNNSNDLWVTNKWNV